MADARGGGNDRVLAFVGLVDEDLVSHRDELWLRADDVSTVSLELKWTYTEISLLCKLLKTGSGELNLIPNISLLLKSEVVYEIAIETYDIRSGTDVHRNLRK